VVPLWIKAELFGGAKCLRYNGTSNKCSARLMLHCDLEVGSVDGVFDPVENSATAVFEYVKEELAVIPCLLLATLCKMYVRE